jgi:DHA2 family multidrug resistance protein
MGGDIGISLVTTMIARRSQFHQHQLAAHTDPFNPSFTASLQAMAQALQHAGYSAAEASKRAYAVVYGQLIKQAQTLAYLDVLFVLAIFTACMVPLVFFTQRMRRGGSAPMAH